MDGSLAPDGWPARTSLGPKELLLIRLTWSENQIAPNQASLSHLKQKTKNRGVLICTHDPANQRSHFLLSAVHAVINILGPPLYCSCPFLCPFPSESPPSSSPTGDVPFPRVREGGYPLSQFNILHFKLFGDLVL